MPLMASLSFETTAELPGNAMYSGTGPGTASFDMSKSLYFSGSTMYMPAKILTGSGLTNPSMRINLRHAVGAFAQAQNEFLVHQTQRLEYVGAIFLLERYCPVAGPAAASACLSGLFSFHR